MQFELHERSQITREVDITVPADEVGKKWSEVSREFARSARIPGFRQGKAPLSVVQKKYESDIRGEIVDRLLPEFAGKVLKETRLHAVGSPHIVRMDELRTDEDFAFTVGFEIFPEFELAEWRGLVAREQPTEVDDEEVAAEIERLRTHAGTLSPVEGAIAKGHRVTIDVTASGEGLETRTTEDYTFEAGDSALPELDGLIIGKKPGDELSFDKTWDETAPNQEVRGKTVRYEVTVKDVKNLELPDIDDDLAKSLNYDDLEQLKSSVRKNIEMRKAREARAQRRAELATALVEQYDFEVPQAMVEEELERSIQEYLRFLASQGVDPRYAEIDWQQLQQDMREESVRRVRRILVLDRIAEAEAVEVSDDEMRDYVHQDAGEETTTVIRSMKASGDYEKLRISVRRHKAMERVVEESRTS